MISAMKKVKWGDGWRGMKPGYLGWAVREDFSEEVAFELRAKGNKRVGHGASNARKEHSRQI